MKTHKEKLIDLLNQCGYISRQRAIFELGITRVAARIQDLEAEGYVFNAVKIDRDFVYQLVSRPKAKQLSLV